MILLKKHILLFILCPFLIQAQGGIIQNDFSKYGPCKNHLNILGYYYSFNELRKDTLYYKTDRFKYGAMFVQNKSKLLYAEFYDEQGKKISEGNFKNGNGKLSIHGNYFYTFKDGKFNDTSYALKGERIMHLCIFKDNVLRKEISSDITSSVVNYDENGILHDSSLFYGTKPVRIPTPFHGLYVDPYRGNLYQVDIYFHGQLQEQIFYNKDGSIKSQKKYKTRPQQKVKAEPKNCW